MSANGKRPYAQMLAVATDLRDWLALACSRVEIAGSLRRKCPTIGDIEIVAVPRLLQVSLFGESDPDGRTAVDELLQESEAHLLKDGCKYKQFQLTYDDGQLYTVDLFLQPDPQTFGVNYLLRTGSASFSKWMVTERRYGGAMPNDYRVRDARVWQYGKVLDTPEEECIFDLWNMAYIAPEERER